VHIQYWRLIFTWKIYLCVTLLACVPPLHGGWMWAEAGASMLLSMWLGASRVGGDGALELLSGPMTFVVSLITMWDELLVNWMCRFKGYIPRSLSSLSLSTSQLSTNALSFSMLSEGGTGPFALSDLPKTWMSHQMSSFCMRSGARLCFWQRIDLYMIKSVCHLIVNSLSVGEQSQRA